MTTTIDVDIGGTFTDCLVIQNKQLVTCKTPTTGYNLAVGFMRALNEAAGLLELSIEDLLRETVAIKYSTTVAMNTLIQRKGPRLGFITTSGFENTIYLGRGAQWADGLVYRELRRVAQARRPAPLIPVEMTVGAKERIDYAGKVVRPLDEEDIRRKVDYLVAQGARGFAICLAFAHVNPVHEQRIRQIIKEEYPEVYLGSMPVVLSSEVLPKRFEYQRSLATILNAYLHGSMAEELREMGDELRALGCQKPMQMVHNTGGMAEVFRTQAIQTYDGGPVAGIMGSAYLGKAHGYDNLIVTDMGGTSFDFSLIARGSTRSYTFKPVIDRWQVDITRLETTTMGAGGGSIAWLDPVLVNRLNVGPQSAGSMPGPACYDLGGTEPTVTDADIVLGYINPDYYFGGRMRLNKDKAVSAIRDTIARPLGMEVDQAALVIKKLVDGSMGDAIFRETVLKGYDPKDFVLFAFGGAGPTHCCGYGFFSGVRKILVSPFSPVFCAFGSANMDIVHFYEYSKRIGMIDGTTQKYLSDYENFNQTVRDLQERAMNDFRPEGLNPEQAIYELELDMRFGGAVDPLRIVSPRLFLESEDDIKQIYEVFVREYSRVYSPYSIYPQGGVIIDNFLLKATIPQPKYVLPEWEIRGEIPPRESIKGKRPVYWEEYGDWRETDIYELELLECGNILEGPAVVEAKYTTLVLPPGAKLTINRFHSAEIEKA